jgi:SLT domain-containing protein
MIGRGIAAATVVVAAVLTAVTVPAAAEQRQVTVRLPNGQVLTVTVDVPAGPLSKIEIPGLLGPPPAAPGPAPAQPAPAPAETAPAPGAGSEQRKGGDRDLRRPKSNVHGRDEARNPRAEGKGPAAKRPSTGLRNSDGSPTAGNPGFVDALPGPAFATGVPNFVIRKFRVPIFLLPIYQAAGIQYGVRWEVLAAINEIETDYGRNLNVSSAGALGWMQFIPSSWRTYGVDANKDGKKDPYNPVDAIFAAARYLKAAGYEKDVRRAIFAYNHADWYVDSVLLRARLVAGVPADLVGSLTGLTEGRFPVAARARYADDLQEAEATRRVERGGNAANVVASTDRRSIEIYAARGAPVIATNDGQIKKVTDDSIVLQDVYGNRFSYKGLGSVARSYPVPRSRDARTSVKAVAAGRDPVPSAAASGGFQPRKGASAKPASPVKRRLFAHPSIAGARESGGIEQLVDRQAGGRGSVYRNYFSRPFAARDARLRPLKVGSQVIGGTVLGRVGRPDATKAPHLEFAMRPAGRGAPRIDPKPILDGWKLLEATAIYRAKGENVLYGDGGFSVGQILLMPKELLERRVLSDARIDIYPGGRDDIRSGQIDRRVLATLEYLAESGLRPAVTSLKAGHGYLTASGNVSEHSSGNAVDIARINGVPVTGHQEPGGVTDQTVRRLMRLQGTLAPHQIISLLDIGGATLAMGDHADHVHVGFRPLFGPNTKLGRQALAVLKPGQWSDLLKRLNQIENPVVAAEPSKHALPAHGAGE